MTTRYANKALLKIGDKEFVIEGYHVSTLPSRVPVTVEEDWMATMKAEFKPVKSYEDDEDLEEHEYQDCND